MWSERIQAVAVGVFLVVIAGVVTVLLTRTDRTAPAAQPFAEESADPDSASGNPVGRVSITTGKGDVVLRITAGSCTAAGGPLLEVSDNQGRTFHQARLPQVDDGTGVSASSPAVRAIAFAEVTSSSTITVAGADAECAVHSYTTDDGGATWTQDPGPVEEWYVDPKTGTVVSPTGATDSGCKSVVEFATVSATIAKAVCANGTIRGTSDGGSLWVDTGKLPEASAVRFTSGQTGYALVVEAQCRSRVYTTVDGGTVWTPLGCVVADQEIPALAGTKKGLVAGGSAGVHLSRDGGTTWKPPTKQ